MKFFSFIDTDVFKLNLINFQKRQKFTRPNKILIRNSKFFIKFFENLFHFIKKNKIILKLNF